MEDGGILRIFLTISESILGEFTGETIVGILGKILRRIQEEIFVEIPRQITGGIPKATSGGGIQEEILDFFCNHRKNI